jgi:hypothetical protein
LVRCCELLERGVAIIGETAKSHRSMTKATAMQAPSHASLQPMSDLHTPRGMAGWLVFLTREGPLPCFAHC